MTELLPEFAKAFVAAQKATEAVKKASSNPAFRSKYADLSAVVEAVIPALNAAGIGVIQSPSFDGELVSVTTTLLHESGSFFQSALSMRPTKADPQGVGSAITYARRYALLAMTGAAPEDDDGNAASAPQKGRQTPASPSDAPHTRAMLEASVAALSGSYVPPPTVMSARALKAANEDGKIKANIEACDLAGLVEWETHFAERTATIPASWHDPIRDMIAHRRAELLAPEPTPDWEARERAMDEDYAATVGDFPGDRPTPVAGRGRDERVNA